MIISTSLFYFSLNLFFIIIGLSEPCPIFQWLIIELAIIRLIPILVKRGGIRGVRRGLKYFLSQSPASLLVLFRVCVLNTRGALLILYLALIFKLGLPPFHGWILSLGIEVGLGELGVILSVQKVLPLVLLTSFLNTYFFMLSLIFLIIITLFICNQVSQLKQLLIFSSMGGRVWPALSQKGGRAWVEFMMVYTGLLLFTTFLFYSAKAIMVKDLINFSFYRKGILIITLFRMGGIPPFSGFFIKLILLKQIVVLSAYLSFLVLSFSFIVLYIYIMLISVRGIITLNTYFSPNVRARGVVCVILNSPLLTTWLCC